VVASGVVGDVCVVVVDVVVAGVGVESCVVLAHLK
jgi:hypothetical protein